jgi:CheY-like chemotaxis protein
MTHILLVEDNDENWDMLSRRLIRRGFAVTRAADGEQAVDRALADSPDLVLMDVNLPLIDGLEATRRIRAAPTGTAVPVIALTAHALVSDRELAFAAGADDYHTKPVEFPRLLEQIEALLASGRPVR